MPSQALQEEGLSEQARAQQQHGIAQLVQTCLRQPPSQGTACSHAASCSSYTSAVHENQAPWGLEDPGRQGGRERGHSKLQLHCRCEGCKPGKASKPRGAQHKSGHMSCRHLTPALREGSCLTLTLTGSSCQPQDMAIGSQYFMRVHMFPPGFWRQKAEVPTRMETCSYNIICPRAGILWAYSPC